MKGRCLTVTDLRTGVTYRSTIEAAKALGITQSGISQAYLKGRDSIKGIPLSFGEGCTAGMKPRPVKCLETGEVFASLSEAARAKKCTPPNIHHAANTPTNTCAGCHWKYI